MVRTHNAIKFSFHVDAYRKAAQSLAHIVQVLPAAQYFKRAGFPIKKIIEYAGKRGYTDLMVFNEDRKEVNGLLVVHLPGGPTAHFKLSKLVLGTDIKVRARSLTAPCLPSSENCGAVS